MDELQNVRDNEGEGRYELEGEGGTAIATYDRRDGALVFTHTQVPKALEGQGIASRLIAGALADVREKGLKVVPLCGFVAGYLDRHPEDQDLLALDAPG
ncbi:GCN5-related N-acetyl-transferase family protein [Sphingobium sp. RAC03]|nr:GCN5-related N-acetyl-transferase family protein [Sphingobium sp. RAC03]